jgi:tellurite resistance-related uncharacterized protein
MKKLVICSVVLLAVGSIADPVFAEKSAVDQMLNRNHMFGLENGDWKILNRGAGAKTYRICMTKEDDAASLKVVHDGQQTIVQPGECHLIQATKIKVASASRLGDGMMLVGSRRVDNSANPSRVASARSATPSGP